MDEFVTRASYALGAYSSRLLGLIEERAQKPTLAREVVALGVSVIGTLNEPNCSNDVTHRTHAELIAEAEQAFTAAKRLVDEQTAIVRRLERTGGCNSEAVDLLNNLRELLAARERRLARVLSWSPWDTAA